MSTPAADAVAVSPCTPEQDARPLVAPGAPGRRARPTTVHEGTWLLGPALRDVGDTTLSEARRQAAMRLALREAERTEDHLVLDLLRTHTALFAAAATESTYKDRVEPHLLAHLHLPEHVRATLAMQPRAVVAAHVDFLLLAAVTAGHADVLSVLVVEYGARVSANDYAALREAVSRGQVRVVREVVRLLGWEAQRTTIVAHGEALMRSLQHALHDSNVGVARELAVSLPSPTRRLAVMLPVPELPLPQVGVLPPPAAAAAAAADIPEAVLAKLRTHYHVDGTARLPAYRVHLYVIKALRAHGLPCDAAVCVEALRAALGVYPIASKTGASTYAVRARTVRVRTAATKRTRGASVGRSDTEDEDGEMVV